MSRRFLFQEILETGSQKLAMSILAENCIFVGLGIPLGVLERISLMMNNFPDNTL